MMLTTTRKPFTPGEILTTEFMEPFELTQGKLAELMGVERRLVNEVCNGHRSVTTETAFMLATVFGTTPEFWMDLQRQTDIWQTMHNENRDGKIL